MSQQPEVPMLCPKCAGRMRPTTRRRIDMDRCESCGGHWIERLALSTSIEATGSDVEVRNVADLLGLLEGPESGNTCPSCHGPLLSAPFDDVTIELCHACSSVFLDPGELEGLIARRRRQHRADTAKAAGEVAQDALLAALVGAVDLPFSKD